MTGSSLRRWAPLVTTSGGLLAWGNLVVPRLPAGPAARAVANAAGTAALLTATRPLGLSSSELGVGRGTWGGGGRAAASVLGAVTAAYAAALAVPAGRDRLAAGHDATLSARALAARATLLSPLGTVLCEEIAFRGVLHATAARLLPRGWALATTSAVFALWHLHHGSAARGTGAPGVLAVTWAGGLALGALRERTGSLLAPAGLHLGTNSVGLLAAARAAAPQSSPRRGWGTPASRARTSDSR